jgi:hypothetical protein
MDGIGYGPPRDAVNFPDAERVKAARLLPSTDG